MRKKPPAQPQFFPTVLFLVRFLCAGAWRAGRYLPASVDQILEVARHVIDQKMQRDAFFISLMLVKEQGVFGHQIVWLRA